MKKRLFLLFLGALFTAESFAQVTAQSLNSTYTQVREAIRAGELDRLTTITDEFVATHPEAADALTGTVTEEYFTQIRDYIEGTATTEDGVEDLVFNIGMVGMAGPGVPYFIQETGIEDTRVPSLLSILGFAIKYGVISDKTVPPTANEVYTQSVLNAVIEAAGVSQWQGNHTDSFNYTEPSKLVPVYALMTNEFGASYTREALNEEVSAQLQIRTLGPAEAWQQPLDIIGEVVRRTTHEASSLYKKIDPRDYFFFIQDHYARVFGAEDVVDSVEFTVAAQGDGRVALVVCNAGNARLNPGVSADNGTSVAMTSIVVPWEEFSRAESLTCGQKIYDVDVDDVQFQAVAPHPSIVRIDDSHVENGFNVVLSYIYFDNLPEDVVQNLINAMARSQEEGGAGFDYVGETPIENARGALQNAISNADMFYRIGHVQGNNLNISYTRGRELLFRKQHDYRGETVEINWRVQIPMTTSTGSEMLSREELSEALWNRKLNGKTQSLWAMGIACRSASYINTWMDAYFEAVMNHTGDLSIDADGNIEGFDPPFVVGATNTFNSGTHREDAAGLESFLRIILISMNHAIHPNPAFDDQDTLRETMFDALASNDTPYRAESNHDLDHTREMSRRLRVVLSHGDEQPIDRVFD